MALRLVRVVSRLVVVVIKVPAMEVNVAAVVAKAMEVNVAVVVAKAMDVTVLMATAMMVMNVLVWGGMSSMIAVVLMTLLKLRETTQLKVEI